MNHFNILERIFMRLFSILFCGIFTTIVLSGQTITHDISTSDLVIQGTNTNNYLVTGSTTAYKIIVGSGYNGTITLRNVSITSSTTGSYSALCGNGTSVVTTGSCMAIMGLNNQSNLTPVTRVNLVLEGYNELLNTQNSLYCGIQVDQGAQIHISAINPNKDSSGVLLVKSTTYEPGTTVSQGGAGIGAMSGGAYNKNQGSSLITGSDGGCPSSAYTCGGNVIISSGIISAYGGHGAGIGGGFTNFYNGIIIITGGVVKAYAGVHAAGIGSGCPINGGVRDCYADNSTIVVLPPAQITAFGSDDPPNINPAIAVAGAINITYINDPNKPLITVRTVDNEPNATIYLDLTETPGLVNVFNAVLPEFALNKVAVGRTDASSGLLQFNGLFDQNTTFFTDASSSQPGTLGRPYLPVITTVSTASEIVLPLLGADISFTDIMSIPLELGYPPLQAYTNAHRIKVEYNDPYPMTNITFALQDKIDFDTLIFLGADGVTPISTPTALNQGDVFYIVLPINQDKSVGVYSDVLLIGGSYMSVPLPGYIRKIGQQRVATDDSQDNIYIKVTASPVSFSEPYGTTNTVTLTLNIDHTGMTGIPYAPLDVTAKYLITTEVNYAAALSANPLNSWSSLTVPPGNNTNTTTDVLFDGLLPETYYIHWYVESGAAYAHSLDVADPPRTYGGFGPYELLPFEICAGTSVTFKATSYDGGTNPSYQWKKNGAIIDGATAITYTYTPEDGDIINCEMVSNAACAEPDTVLSQSILVKVNSPLPPVFNPVSDVCDGDSIIFSVSSSYSAYEWHLGDSTGAIVSTDSSIIQTNPGIYTYVLRVQDEQGCWGNYTLPVIATIKSLPAVFVAGSDSICIGIQTQLSPSEGGSWVSNNPSVASVTNDGFVTGIAVGSATFTFTSLVTGCSNTTDTVSVGAFPIVNAITAEKNTVCLAATIQLSCTPLGGIWTLSNDHGQIVGLSANNPVEIEGITPGQVYVSYILGTGTCKSISTFSLKIIPATLPEILTGFER